MDTWETVKTDSAGFFSLKRKQREKTAVHHSMFMQNICDFIHTVIYCTVIYLNSR